ncbi:MAG: hypothetical protein ACE5IK_12290 [Acidobacteriota bacterium]
MRLGQALLPLLIATAAMPAHAAVASGRPAGTHHPAGKAQLDTATEVVIVGGMKKSRSGAT